MKKFTVTPWIPCECPECGHKQEAHPFAIERGPVACDHCGHQTEPQGCEPK